MGPVAMEVGWLSETEEAPAGETGSESGGPAEGGEEGGHEEADAPEGAPAEAHGEEPHGEEHGAEHGGEHGFAAKFLVGGAVGVLRPGGETPEVHGVSGLFGAWVAVPKMLELELALKAIGSEPAADAAVLLAKKPFHASKRVHPFVGVGPSLTLVLEEGATAVHPGFEGVVGSYIWASPRVGLTVELAEGAVFEEGMVWETGASVGLVVGL